METFSLPQGEDSKAPAALHALPVIAATSASLVVLLLVFPSLDLVIARQFYTGNGQFFGETSVVSQGLRNLFIAVYLVGCGVCIAGLAITRDKVRPFLNMGFTKWLFLALCVSIGPGVVANLALKDQWGRARPRDVAEFGGTRSFSAAMAPSKECVRNCSFVCGESSSIFALFFAGACLWRKRSITLILAGLAAGGAAGVVRMSQGAHFLSDVVFSGIFMALSVLALHWLFDVIATSGQVEPDVSLPVESLSRPSHFWYEVAAE